VAPIFRAIRALSAYANIATMNWSGAGSIKSGRYCPAPAAASSLRLAGESCDNRRRWLCGHHGSDGNGNGAVYVWGAKDFPRQYGYTSFLGLGFFDGVHFVSSTESNGVQVTYCDDVACRNNCVVGSNLSPP